MKLQYRAVGASDSSLVTLFDEATGGTMLSEFDPEQTTQFQDENIALSSVAMRAARGNVRISQPMELLIPSYASPGAALDALVTNFSGFQTLVVFKLTDPGSSNTYWYPNVAVTKLKQTIKGCSLYISLQVTSDPITTTEPT